MSRVRSYRGYRVSVQLVRECEEDRSPARIGGARDVYGVLQELSERDREEFWTLHLDARHHLVGCEQTSVGTLSTSLVHPREVYKAAILSSAAAIIIAHNHPSGDPSPSPEDFAVSQRLYHAGEILGIPLLDSVIIGSCRYHSLRESGQPPFP
jgi:DNA repair protein RadC